MSDDIIFGLPEKKNVKFELDEQKIVKYLSDNIGKKKTSSDVVIFSGAYSGDEVNIDDIGFELDHEVHNIANKYDFYLNSKEHENMNEGFPWNIDFIIEKESKKKKNIA